jgi:nucleoside-diphosphate-sugar epimerase
MQPSTTLLVTGAGGFIGSHVTAAMAQDGCKVWAGARRALDNLPEGTQSVSCDLDNREQVTRAMHGVDLVIHTAYGDEAAMKKQAENLLAAMSSAKVCSLLAFSSVAVYGARTGVIAEDDAPLPPLGEYARAKLDCEALYRCWAAADPDRRVIALRPGIVYGTGSKLWIDKMARRIISGAWGVFGAYGDGRAALIHIDDLARQCIAASRILSEPSRTRLAPFEAVNCVGPERPRWNEFFQALAFALGQRPLRHWSPAELFFRQALAVPAKAIRRLGLPVAAGLALAPPTGELALFGLDSRISDEKAHRLLKYEPNIGLANGLARSGLHDVTRFHSKQ